MPVVIGVVLRHTDKIYYFDPGAARPEVEEKVVVETARGIEIGEVVFPAKEITPEEVITPLKKVIRPAGSDDIQKDDENKIREKEAYKTGQDKIRKHALPMKLVDTECLFDGSKIVFYFTAEGRVDFRELVKDLAASFKTRIELRQIGVRDEAKSIGGLGPCGRDLCCRTFLADFEPVSIKMAKEQNLPLNPIKISGVCSRLMCCLKYENEVYVEFRKRAPKIGKDVKTPDGIGRVVSYCAPKDSVVVSMADSHRQIQVPLADVREADKKEIEQQRAEAREQEKKADERREAAEKRAAKAPTRPRRRPKKEEPKPKTEQPKS
jgi:cell fate regulator YaaT (PSP1 superfamily)